jgi:hypothetical protein
MKKEVQQYELQLFLDIRGLIDASKKAVSVTLNTEVTSIYWNIGNRINTAILKNKRADYGKQIIATLWRHLSWSHFKLLIPIKNELQRNFYAQMCRVENWNVATLRKKIG